MSSQPVECGRDQALDFTKGALVVLMVFYHWINYFISTDGMVYRYIRFITPSFIFITGFLVARVYLAKFNKTDLLVQKRLFQRGVKLLALFTALNLAATLVVSNSYHGSEGVELFFKSASAIYGSGNGGIAVFQILVPISYVLILSAALLAVRRWMVFPVHAVCFALSACILVVNLCGLKSGNMELVGVGFLGVYFGSFGKHRVNNWMAKIAWVLSGYIVYLAAIAAFEALYPLQIVGVCLNLLLIYWLGAKWTEKGVLLSRILLLGRYSLLAYIAQIVILQVLVRIMQPVSAPVPRLTYSLLGVLILTQLTVEVMEWIRTRSTVADQIGRASCRERV